MEDFLIEHKLSRLLLTYREIQSGIVEGERSAAIEQLQRSYATELFKPITDPAWADQLLERAKLWLAANPMRQTQRLRLAVAHREVELMLLAFLNGDRIFQVDQIVNEINSIQRGVKQQVDDLERLSELQQASLGDGVRLQDQQQLLRHGEYLLGWSYFLLSSSKQRQDRQILRDAESSFRSYLDLPPFLNLTKFSEEKFGKENRFQRSATIGLAIVMQAIGAEVQAKHCFSIAETHASSSTNSEREIDNIVRWKFIASLDKDNSSAAKSMLADQPEILGDSVLLNAILNRTDADAELTSLAMIELALSFQTDRLKQLIERSPDAFAILAELRPWISGLLAWEDFQIEGDSEILQLATGRLQAAVQEFSETQRPAIRGHGLFLLANCNLEQKNYLAATNGFLTAIKLLRDKEPNLAAEAAYRAFQTSRLLPENQRQQGEKIAVGLIENFPQSKFAQLAEFELTLQQLKNESNLDAIQSLARYRSGNCSDIVVSAAIVAMARRYASSSVTATQSFRDFMETVNSDNRASIHSKIEANYYYLSALLAQSNSAELKSEIEDVSSKLKSLLNHPDSTKRKQQTVRFIYYQTMVLRRLHPDARTEAFNYFQQLQSFNVSSPWTLAATTEVAKFFEDIEDSRFATEPVLRQRMIDVYQALQTILSTAASTNRDAVEIRLAKLYLADGKTDALNDLTEDVPKNASWLPIIAEMAEAQGDIHRSETLWQRLEEALPLGTDPWWKARLNRLKVLHKIDADKAKAMLDRTISLYPEAPQSVSAQLLELSERWRAR